MKREKEMYSWVWIAMNMLITTISKLPQVKFFLISFVVPVQALNILGCSDR